MERTISISMGKGSLAHNNRKFVAENVDRSRVPDNVIYRQEDLKAVYHKLFDNALQEYNSRQKRKDRKIADYYEKIRQSRQEKLFYEMIVQIGNRDDMGVKDSEMAGLAKEILSEYMEEFQARNPNLYVFNAVLHMDEATPHLHMDYIPVAHGYKTGLSTRNSLAKGLQEMGIEPAKGKNDNETMHWQQREREYLTDLCRKRGLEIGVLGIKRDDYSIPEYKAAMREVEAAEAEIEILRTEKEEAESLLEVSLDKIGSNIEAIEDQKETLEEIEKQITEAEENRTRIMSDMSRMVKAGEKAEEEAAKIERSAKEVKSLLDKEPMVKIPRKDFDELILTYKVAEAVDILYRDSCVRLREQQGLIKTLKEEIAGLTNKIKQFTNFIESKGLLQAFKEFLKPKSVIAKLKENKAIVAERSNRDHKVIPDSKKKRSAVR